MESSVAPVNEPDKVNILLIDDQQAKLLSYEVVLAEIGETLIKASSACEAFECLLKNLALNARDAMPDGGIFMISAEEINGQTELPLSPGDYVHIRIVDTGVGMDEATRAKATEPFFTTKGAGMGTGLGLSVVHGIVIQSGGRLRIDSEPNVGTTVELWLPQSIAYSGSVGNADNLRIGRRPRRQVRSSAPHGCS
jgi:signal transduction histidine kinase